MKKKNLLSFLVLLCALSAHADEWIRINLLGYLPQSIKVAVFMSEEGTDIQSFQIFNAQTDKLERTIPAVRQTGEWGNMKSLYCLSANYYFFKNLKLQANYSYTRDKSNALDGHYNTFDIQLYWRF